MESEIKETKEKISAQVLKTILQDGVDFEVTRRRKGLFGSKRKFIIFPIKLGALFEISKIILTMENIDALKDEDVFSAGIKTVVANKDKMLDIVALAILNRKTTLWGKIRKWGLVWYLDRNLDARELLRLVQLVIVQMDVTDFLASFVSIKRLNMVEAINRRNTSTGGKSSEDSSNISDSA